MDGAGGQIDSAGLHRTPHETDRLARPEVFRRVFWRIKRNFPVFIFLSSIFLSASASVRKMVDRKIKAVKSFHCPDHSGLIQPAIHPPPLSFSLRRHDSRMLDDAKVFADLPQIFLRSHPVHPV